MTDRERALQSALDKARSQLAGQGVVRRGNRGNRSRGGKGAGNANGNGNGNGNGGANGNSGGGKFNKLPPPPGNKNKPGCKAWGNKRKRGGQ